MDYTTQTGITVQAEPKEKSGPLRKYMEVAAGKIKGKCPENNIAPTVYLEPFYESYSNGANLGAVMKNIADVSAENQVRGLPDMSIIKNIHNFDSIKDRLRYALSTHRRMMSCLPRSLISCIRILLQSIRSC